ncbi:hypothetical protein P7C70_g7068, partial [Phenoliferia sp. Uapishka_3]
MGPPSPLRPLPTLPLELIAHIIELSVPPIQWSTFPLRYELLTRFSLVSHFCRSIAQPRLYSHILLDSNARLVAFVAALALAGRARATQVRSIRLGREDEGDRWCFNEGLTFSVEAFAEEKIRELLGMVGSCEELWVRRCQSAPSTEYELNLSALSHPSMCSQNFIRVWRAETLWEYGYCTSSPIRLQRRLHLSFDNFVPQRHKPSHHSALEQ